MSSPGQPLESSFCGLGLAKPLFSKGMPLLSWGEGGCFVPRDTAQGSGSGSLSLPGKSQEKPEIQRVAAEKWQAQQMESAAEEGHLLGVRRHTSTGPLRKGRGS